MHFGGLALVPCSDNRQKLSMRRFCQRRFAHHELVCPAWFVALCRHTANCSVLSFLYSFSCSARSWITAQSCSGAFSPHGSSAFSSSAQSPEFAYSMQSAKCCFMYDMATPARNSCPQCRSSFQVSAQFRIACRSHSQTWPSDRNRQDL